MQTQEIAAILQEQFGDTAVLSLDEQGLQAAIFINPSDLVAICFYLRDKEGLYFDFLNDLAAVDYGVQEAFLVRYQLTSIPYGHQLVLKVRLESNRALDQLPELPSVSAVWRSADWHEREAYDLMGVFFNDHPDLRRILLPDDWQGHPLRKDYQDPETYHGIAIK